MNPSASEIELEIAAFHKPAIDSARKMITAAGALYLILPVALFAILASLAGPKIFATAAFAVVMAIGTAVFGLHLALSWWAKKSPLPATSVALAVFLAYNGALVYAGELPSPIITIVGLVILGRAVFAGYRVHKLRSRV